ncbi:MAG: hypothetical protein HKP44_00355 [Desulfofustis sp.]|nr:hypothetical protein [Desulfofustis sp.]NNK55746.1 hypothetical protein [Desulfofustis sp.]
MQVGLIAAAHQQLADSEEARIKMVKAVEIFGLSDLCIATDARYIRHLAVSDRLAPFMDHPGSIEHFPTGSFWIPER